LSKFHRAGDSNTGTNNNDKIWTDFNLFTQEVVDTHPLNAIAL